MLCLFFNHVRDDAATRTNTWQIQMRGLSAHTQKESYYVKNDCCYVW